MNQDMKYGYLDETYETICPLGEQDIFCLLYTSDAADEL